MKIRYCAVALVAFISAASAQPAQDPLERFRHGTRTYDWKGLVESRAIHAVKGAQFQPDQLRAFLPKAWRGWNRLNARNVEQAEELRLQLVRLERELRAIEAPRDALAYYRTPGGFDWATINAQNVLFRPSAYALRLGDLSELLRDAKGKRERVLLREGANIERQILRLTQLIEERKRVLGRSNYDRLSKFRTKSGAVDFDRAWDSLTDRKAKDYTLRSPEGLSQLAEAALKEARNDVRNLEWAIKYAEGREVSENERRLLRVFSEVGYAESEITERSWLSRGAHKTLATTRLPDLRIDWRSLREKGLTTGDKAHVREVALLNAQRSTLRLDTIMGRWYMQIGGHYPGAEHELRAIRNRLRAIAKAYPGDLGKWAQRLELNMPKDAEVRGISEAGRELTDRFASFRRADGTVDWKAVKASAGSRVAHEVGGAGHFALALFLKEFAQVVATGDALRMEEFFDYLASTDFFKHYGLFVLGARSTEVAYQRYLAKHIKPRFMRGALKSHLALAAGMALPLIAEGNFEGKTYAISLASLGLSSVAVRAGVRGLSWVRPLSQARKAGVGGAALKAGRLARMGGWFYTAGELAVILLLSEQIDHQVNDWLDERAARSGVQAASEAFRAVVADPQSDADQIAAAARELHETFGAYRNFLYRPLHAEEARLAVRLQKVAEASKLNEDRAQAALHRLENQRALRERMIERYGSLQAYAEHLRARGDQALDAQVAEATRVYAEQREELLEKVYQGNEREGSLLRELDRAELDLAFGGTPQAQRSDFFAERARRAASRRLGGALDQLSRNRLQVYEDELALLAAAQGALERRGQVTKAAALQRTIAITSHTKALDAGLLKEPAIERKDGILSALAADR